MVLLKAFDIYGEGGILGTLHAMFMLKTIGAAIKIAKATTNNQ